jgi:dolichol-phosphate mannosyltransferase
MAPLVVLPTYDEAENVVEVLGRIRASLPTATVLVVDDGSPDGTAELAEGEAATRGQIEVLRRTGKAGLGSAYRAGFAWGLERGFDVLIEMDADLSHDADDLPALVAATDYADLAIGSRYVPGGSIPAWSWHRRFLSRWGNRYSAGVLGLAVNDATSGFRAYRAETLGKMDFDTIQADGYTFQIEMAYEVVRLGGRIVEVPIAFRDRLRGTSKMSGTIVVEALGLVTWWGFRDRLLRRGRRPRR